MIVLLAWLGKILLSKYPSFHTLLHCQQQGFYLGL